MRDVWKKSCLFEKAERDGAGKTIEIFCCDLTLKGQQVTHFWQSFSISESAVRHIYVMWTILRTVFPATKLVWRKYLDKIQFILYQARIGLWQWSKLIHVIY